jgi:hypothetical protein
VSIVDSLRRLVDPVAAREHAARMERLRKPPRDDAQGGSRGGAGKNATGKAYECRVCGLVGTAPDFCPECLAQTMRPTDKPLPLSSAPRPGAESSGAETPGEPAAVPAVAIPIDGTLDLHTVRPGEAAELVAEYLEACAAAGIGSVRLVHGKGTGDMRRTVHAHLARSPRVASFATADESAGGWGATLVTLK